MAGRGFKGHIAVCSTTLLLIMNLLVLAGGIATVVLVFIIEHQPSRAAWLIVIAGAFTIGSGLIGLCSSTRRGCFTLQLILLAFSVIGLLATAFAIFFKPTQVRHSLDKPYYSAQTTITLLKILSAVAFVTGCVQVSVILDVAYGLGCLRHGSGDFGGKVRMQCFCGRGDEVESGEWCI